MPVVTSTVKAATQGFCDVIDLTEKVENAIRQSGVRDGLVVVANPGSTASITTVEYEPGLIEDLRDAVERVAPSSGSYKHDLRWGDGNGFSHVRSAMFGPSVTLPVHEGRMVRGTWQQIVLLDFDNRPRRREVIVTVVGE
jgi:secondary thiamine-phosphate synthase enzyme